jgi:superfamily II DNA or RNA helicase
MSLIVESGDFIDLNEITSNKPRFKLEQYQETFLQNIGKAISKYKSVLAQLTTGGGKTVVFAAIAYRFLKTSKKDVIIFCDSDKILFQTRRTLLNWYGIDSDIINADSAHIKRNSLFGQPRVFVAMVETFDRRSKRSTFLQQVSEVGLVIVDECHMGNFYKIFDHFLFSLRIGFTATPMASDKKKPLRSYYDTIVCGPKTSELIEFNRINPGRGVVRDVTYSLQNNINRKEIEQEELELGFKGNDFNQDLTGKKLSAPKQIQNTIDAIVKHAPGKKLLVFNANVAHSKLVTEEMRKYGLNARHLDADCSDEYKKDCYDWLEKTTNAILCNVGMTTKGFDVPSIEGVVLNRLTKSKVLYNQMCGRAVRPYMYPNGTYKEYGIILDMCDNVLGGGHGQWSDDTDWEYIFNNPKMPKQGVAPSKICPECDGICSAGARKCTNMVEDYFDGGMMECGYLFPQKDVVYDETEKAMVLISKDVDVEKIIDFPAFQGKREYFTFHETVRACAYQTSKNLKTPIIEKDEFEKIWELTHGKIIEWQTITGRRHNGRKKADTEWFTRTGREDLLRYLREYNFIVELND